MLTLLLILAGIVSVASSDGLAAPSPAPPGPDRFSVVTVDYTEYYWWLIRWGETEVECKIKVDHEGLPTPGDIYIDCGEEVYDKWVTQKPCLASNTNECKGFYLILVDSRPAQKEISTKLPPPTVQVTLENCSPVYTSSTSICEFEPILVLTGLEPLPDHTIIGIEGLYGEQPFTCGAVCRLQLPVTGEQGITLQFWAYSSYGDSSEVFNALVRVALADEGNPDRSFWYVDVLSSQWAGVPIASCVQAWGVLPPVGGPPEWISTPTESEKLGTDVPYNYLAAQLIRNGVVDASSCPDGGLLPDGGASTCGMEVARGAVTQWQNQFDTIILNVARESGAPAHLLKNIFATESQFWPGSGPKTDVGLGQLTELGADTAFLWNPPFFHQFCPLVMDSAECSKGYLNLDEEQRAYLRLALIDAVDSTCPECPLGIDMDRANFSIGVFAHTLLANCEQAGQLVENYTGGMAGASATYEDLWKFTLVNYNVGPGCLGEAIDLTIGGDQALTWENLSLHLAPACQGAIEYVNDISRSR
ncbi:MAG: hypothetical protein L0287_35275 [Anaerolineae bacterium]|nr:hypothetical protein [Anaerolineae bacterium]